MIKRLIFNDIRRNKLTSISTFIFMTISAMLLGLTIFLFTNLSSSIDNLMKIAMTPDFLQMHSGEINLEEVHNFVESDDKVKDWQISRFLNIENGIISLDGYSLNDNAQDNGLCVQNENFDYLLTTDNEIAIVQEREVYVPVCYKIKYGLECGSSMQIGKETFVIAGFLRDSQMNSMMASSKRFLVNQKDYSRLKEIGSEEYLIEFLLKDGSDLDAFATEYSDAGLPSNGPAITHSLIKMMNALSDGMMIFVILLVSTVMLIISIICIRFILITSLEKDRAEIGMLKVIGIEKRDIRRLYITKFILLSVSGAIVGLILAFVLSKPLGWQIHQLYGESGFKIQFYLFSIIGAVFAEGILLMFVKNTLRNIESISAIEAISGSSSISNRNKKAQYILISVLIITCVFLMIVPKNISSTISSAKFITYMGVGNAQIRLDVRQTDDILEKTEKLAHEIDSDKRVKNYSLLQTKALKAETTDGTVSTLIVEFGDHKIFPVSYISGNAPEKNGQLALSVLNARELNVQVGDSITISKNKEKEEYTICGIYSDITNGGKTSKAYLYDNGLLDSKDNSIMWSIVYVTLYDESNISNWISDYRTNFGMEDGTGIKMVDIEEYVSEIYGQTITQIDLAANVAMVCGGMIIFIVILLFIKMIVEKDRMEISLKKSLGFTTKDIREEYLKGSLFFIVIGVIGGILSGIFIGEILAGLVLNSMGAADFKFILDYGAVLLRIPVIILFVSMIAVRISLYEVKKISAYECCVGKE